MRANIHHRGSIARAYPRDAFAADASANDRGERVQLRGVRIASAPDAAGDFEIERAAQQVGEVPGAVFLAPFHRTAAAEHAPADPNPHAGYEAFLTDIAEAARSRGFRAEATPGRGDPRLRGERQ
jgi:hypothetical protein